MWEWVVGSHPHTGVRCSPLRLLGLGRVIRRHPGRPGERLLETGLAVLLVECQRLALDQLAPGSDAAARLLEVRALDVGVADDHDLVGSLRRHDELELRRVETHLRPTGGQVRAKHHGGTRNLEHRLPTHLPLVYRDGLGRKLHILVFHGSPPDSVLDFLYYLHKINIVNIY